MTPFELFASILCVVGFSPYLLLQQAPLLISHSFLLLLDVKGHQNSHVTGLPEGGSQF